MNIETSEKWNDYHDSFYTTDLSKIVLTIEVSIKNDLSLTSELSCVIVIKLFYFVQIPNKFTIGSISSILRISTTCR